MTLKAGTILDITETCDKTLEYFYFNKNSMVDLDTAQIELPFPHETYDIAIKNLEKDGHLKIRRTKSNSSGQITPDGELFYRTTSYQRIAQNLSKGNIRAKRKERFEFAKGIFEILFGFVTIVLTIWTFTLDRKVDTYEVQIKKIQTSLDSLSKKYQTPADTSIKSLK